MSKSALEIVQAFQQSQASGTDEWQSLFADDIVFKGPVAFCEGKEANIELNKQFFPLIKSYVHKSSMEQGSMATIEGTFTVSTPKGNEISFDMAEIYEIKNGKIQSIRVYYDAEEFRKEFAPVEA